MIKLLFIFVYVKFNLTLSLEITWSLSTESKLISLLRSVFALYNGDGVPVWSDICPNKVIASTRSDGGADGTDGTDGADGCLSLVSIVNVFAISCLFL